MKTTMCAVLKNGRTGEDVQKVELCNVMLDDGMMSAERYNRLKRQMLRTVKAAPKSHYWALVTTEGLRDTFGGYPAFANVSFVKEDK